MNSQHNRLITKDKTIHRLTKTIVCGVLVGVMTLGPVQVTASSANTVTTTANLRMRTGASLDSEVIKTVPEGSVIRVVNAENRYWYRVEFNGVQGYMSSEFLISQGISLITEANLRLRTGPSLGAEIIMTAPEGSVVQILSYVNNDWYRVEFNGQIGYMFSEFLSSQYEASSVSTEVVTEAVPPVVEAYPVIEYLPPAQSVAYTEATQLFATANLRLRAEPSTSGEILKTVRQGSTVYVIGSANDDWKRVTHNGVSGYMFASYLFDRNELSAPVVGENGVELLHWSYARNNVIRTGVPMQVTDVRTGITYWVSSFSNGNHADVEPITAHDTAEMLRAFGGQWTWTPRPILVHVDGRTIAASINGMPHAGSTNANNNMNGHVCMHFYGSRTHNGSVGHERDHQAAVQEALNAAR